MQPQRFPPPRPEPTPLPLDGPATGRTLTRRIEEERAAARIWRDIAHHERERADEAALRFDLAHRRLMRIERLARRARRWRDVAAFAAGVLAGGAALSLSKGVAVWLIGGVR